jgi:4-hydroxy-2-oxoheptanedioate aldolase
VEGLDGVLVGPFDLTLALGGRGFGDPAVAERLEDALSNVASVARKAGIAAGVHCTDGAAAARRLSGPFSFATVGCDLIFLQDAAKTQLVQSRSRSSLIVPAGEASLAG